MTPPAFRALCIRARPSPVAPAFMEPVLDEWIRALALHCALTVLTEDFDLAQACDAHRPDFIIYEGLNTLRPAPLRIAAPHCQPGIPRAMFLNVDPHDAMRPHIWRMVETHRVEAVFAYDSDHEEQMPELAGMTYAAPMFVDTTLHRDRGLEKLMPVSVFGGLAEPRFYAWRATAVPLLQARLPTLVYTHPGYRSAAAHPFAVAGEAYARLLNRSWFSLADATRLDYVVRKHLEIPANGAILVAPPSPALDDYGLVDMQTCITGAARELPDKLDAVARDAEMYERIRLAGLHLVQTRHAAQRWRCIADWFAARRTQGPGEMTQQHGLGGPFATRPAGEACCRDMPHRPNAVTAALGMARAAILGGEDLDEAETRLRGAAGWLAHLTEPWLLLGVLALLRGAHEEARACLLRPASIQMQRHAPHLADEAARLCLDPVEAAFLLLLADLLGDAALMRFALDQSAGVRHRALRRMLRELGEPESGDDARRPGDRPSIHWLGQEDAADWAGLVARIRQAARVTPPPAPPP